ncbi:caspase family protein [Spirosoma arcticum]
MRPFLYPAIRGLLRLIGRLLVPVGMGLVTFGGRAQTLHAIMVADTKDPVLARACAYDVAVVHRQLVQVSAAIGYRLNEQLISQADFGRKQLDKALQSVSPQPNDILLFYYSGHGYNLNGRADRFPILMLDKKAGSTHQNPGLLAIHTLLKRKKARLCITLGDCCNTIASTIRGQPTKRVLPKPLMLTNDSLNAAYRNLFLNVSGDALIASSAPPQRALAHPDSGSFYTRAFDEALDVARQHPGLSWASLLGDAQTRLTRHAATRTKRSIYDLNIVPSKNPVSVLTALTVALRTDRGHQNVEYRAGDQMQIEVKANRSCHLRLVYLLADGTRTLLENDFVVKPGQENKYVRIAPAESFICAAPFGTEHLLVYAAEAPFCPLPTTPNPSLYVRNEGGYSVIVGSQSALAEAVKCTITPTSVAEDRIQITTRANQ